MRSLTLLPTPLLALLTATAASALDASSLKIDYTTPATCSRPTRNGDSISVNYRGSLLSNGVEFDESYKRGAPFNFKLGAGEVIEGWDLGLLDMCPGERRNLTIPPELGYGLSGAGPIPGGATLRFETELVDILGVMQETVSFGSNITANGTASVSTMTEAVSTKEGAFGIATAPPEPPKDGGKEGSTGGLTATPLNDSAEQEAPDPPQEPIERNECQLLGPFALLVQGALGAFAILSLVGKRYRETPKRPWKIWFFDVSKQVLGSMLTHVLNLAMSMMGTVDVINAAATKGIEEGKHDPQGRQPNPCSYYLLNLGIDVSLGVRMTFESLNTNLGRRPPSGSLCSISSSKCSTAHSFTHP